MTPKRQKYTIEGLELKCPHCKHKWIYKGKREYYTSCPDCKSSVKIK